MKKLQLAQKSDRQHWVGDGFPVRSIFNYTDLGAEMSPFLLMDYAVPTQFSPSRHLRGVGEHPHRGFETVTIVYDGEVRHRDSAGGGGLIRAGDVQWMTAASGLVHEEMHGEDFAKTGGSFEMVQLWVNLPKKDKMGQPKYQGITKDRIPSVVSPEGAVRVIAGEWRDTRGPAQTHTPLNLWDITVRSGATLRLQVPQGHTASLLVLRGPVLLNGDTRLETTELAVLEREGTEFTLTADREAKLLFMGGEPINEPIVGYGPFVMNSKQEILQAISDFEQGKMGQLVRS